MHRVASPWTEPARGPDRRVRTLPGRIAGGATAVAVRVETRLLGAGLFAAIAAFGVLGYVHDDDPGSPLYLDGEGVPPAWFSTGLLVLVAVLLLLSWRLEEGWPGATAWLGLGLVFSFMAGDEVAALHEHLEHALNFDWQLLYLPVMALAAFSWLRVMGRLGPLSLPAALLGAGALVWGVAQVFEAVQWEGAHLEHPGLVPPEEILEMTGSALFALAAHLHVRRFLGAARRPARR